MSWEEFIIEYSSILLQPTDTPVVKFIHAREPCAPYPS